LVLVFFFNDLIGLVLTLMVALIFVLIGPVVAMGAGNRMLMGKHALGTFDSIAFWGSVVVVVGCGLLAFV
jgi:hypothetical protein